MLEGVHEKVRELNERILPAGMRIEPFYDRTTLVGLTLETVHHSLLFGALLVAGVVWLFLRSVRCSLIVAAIIPLALLTAFIGLRWLGLPANLISMGAIDFGILVDGAVVLVENVLHEAAASRPASRRELLSLVATGAQSVATPTFFAMAIIIAALLPVFTLERVEGRIFRPLAMTYSFALAGALVFALTAVPALCALLLRPKDGARGEPGFLIVLRRGYARALAVTLRRPVLVGCGAVVLLAGGLLAQSRLGSEFLPELDEGDLVIFVEMPPSISLDAGGAILTDARKRLLAFPEVIEAMSEQGRPEDGTDDEGVNMSETFVHLKPHDEWRRGLDKDRLVEAMRASLTEIPGVDFNFSQPIKDNVEEAISGVRGKVVLKIFGPDLEAMRDTLEKCKATLASVPGIVDLELYRDATVPQLRVVLDRPALARAGITVGTAQDLVETSLEGRVVTAMWEGERPVPVRVMFPLTERHDPDAIGAIPVPTAGGGRIPLHDLASLTMDTGRACINREANSRVLALKFNVEGRDMGSVVKDARDAVDRAVKPPDGHYFVWGGEFENQARAMRRLATIVPVSILAVFSLLYMALQSARSAAAVLAIAPFAMTGGGFALLAGRVDVSVSAAVGFIALLGQVSLAALLVISAIDARRRAGESLDAAVVSGSVARLRAVLMTALLAILGLTPMALSRGVGSEIQRPFALVIIGGLFTSIAVVLFLLPLVYRMLTTRELARPGDEDLAASALSCFSYFPPPRPPRRGRPPRARRPRVRRWKAQPRPTPSRRSPSRARSRSSRARVPARRPSARRSTRPGPTSSRRRSPRTPRSTTPGHAFTRARTPAPPPWISGASSGRCSSSVSGRPAETPRSAGSWRPRPTSRRTWRRGNATRGWRSTIFSRSRSESASWRGPGSTWSTSRPSSAPGKKRGRPRNTTPSEWRPSSGRRTRCSATPEGTLPTLPAGSRCFSGAPGRSCAPWASSRRPRRLHWIPTPCGPRPRSACRPLRRRDATRMRPVPPSVRRGATRGPCRC